MSHRQVLSQALAASLKALPGVHTRGTVLQREPRAWLSGGTGMSYGTTPRGATSPLTCLGTACAATHKTTSPLYFLLPRLT